MKANIIQEEKILKRYLGISIIYNSFLIFYTLFPAFFTMIVSMVYIIWSVIYLKREGFFVSILFISIALIPSSFISILGTHTSVFPISWFHIMVCILMIYIILNRIIDKMYLLSIMLFIMYALINSLLQKNIYNALTQVLMIILFMFGFFISDFIVHSNSSESYFEKVSYIYVMGVFSTIIQILIQYFLINYLGIIIGNYEIMSGRIAYGGLMGDFSFTTLYIATGIFIIMLWYFEYHTIGLIKFGMMEFICLLSILIVTSRTGLFALVVTLILYFLFHLRKFKVRYIVVILAAFLFLPIVINILMSNRAGQSLMDGSGRIETYVKAMNLFFEKFLFGYGFGLKNFSINTGIGIPHNFFIQYFLQCGFIGTILIILPFIHFLKKYFIKADCSKWLLVLVSIGSMLIPDIMNSRFLYGIIILISLSSNYLKIKENARRE